MEKNTKVCPLSWESRKEDSSGHLPDMLSGLYWTAMLGFRKADYKITMNTLLFFSSKKILNLKE